jgi:hypothetical protein
MEKFKLMHSLGKFNNNLEALCFGRPCAIAHAALAPRTGLMNDILAPMLRKFVLVFVDDILIYSKTLLEHAGHLEEVLSILRENKLKVKKSKCTFAK